MKERPILFSGPMVRAILEGRKTQTRRVVKFGKAYASKPPTPEEAKAKYGGSGFCIEAGFFDAACPFSPHQRLWVKETWGLHRYFDGTDWNRDSVKDVSKADLEEEWKLAHRADWGPMQSDCFWRPSIHMPRWASRLSLPITGVRVERLQDISEEDALAEGVEPYAGVGPEQRVPGPGFDGALLKDQPHRLPFADLWNGLNESRGFGWDANPWVWAISFNRATP